jgi:hypothetical protein
VATVHPGYGCGRQRSSQRWKAAESDEQWADETRGRTAGGVIERAKGAEKKGTSRLMNERGRSRRQSKDVWAVGDKDSSATETRHKGWQLAQPPVVAARPSAGLSPPGRALNNHW